MPLSVTIGVVPYGENVVEDAVSVDLGVDEVRVAMPQECTR